MDEGAPGLVARAWFAGIANKACVVLLTLLSLQLARISERLHVLEEQHKAWRKEEPLVYSMLLSACLVNTWLWLWR
uniref:Mff-like domain-containing protein n=1 Tax=Coturnix japonica TaxID=93934 RepID=A0A8C2TZH6_COTJA